MLAPSSCGAVPEVPSHLLQVLKGLDARVDGMINAASGLYASNAVALQHAVVHSERGLAAAAAAKDAYLQRIESALGLLKVIAGLLLLPNASCITNSRIRHVLRHVLHY
jgi:hypothetical protein